MPRIRTLKPEFQDSEKMERISRDARLTFILLWPQCDDYGRMRARPTLLAAKLFPYDKDAPDLIEGWLDELEQENCIVRYVVDGALYLQIVGWNEHQKVDHPGKPSIPEMQQGQEYRPGNGSGGQPVDNSPVRESSRDLAKVSETLAPDLVPSTVVPSTVVPSTKDRDLVASAREAPKTRAARAKRASLYPEDLQPDRTSKLLATELGVNLRAEFPMFRDHHCAKGSRFIDWQAAIRTWIRRAAKPGAGLYSARPVIDQNRAIGQTLAERIEREGELHAA